MKTLIIKSHPYEGSFNAAIIKTIQENVRGQCEVLDLLSEGFNPAVSVEELKRWSDGLFPDSLSEKYCKMLKEVDLVVFPFPVWWGGPPAILKGYFDKVFLPGHVYDYDENGALIGLLNKLKAVVIVTMEVSEDIMENVYNNPVRSALLNVTLETCGAETTYIQFGNIVSSTQEEREEFLASLAGFFGSME